MGGPSQSLGTLPGKTFLKPHYTRWIMLNLLWPSVDDIKVSQSNNPSNPLELILFCEMVYILNNILQAATINYCSF